MQPTGQTYDPSKLLVSPQEKGNSDHNFKFTFLLHTIRFNSYIIIITIICHRYAAYLQLYT